MKALLDTCIIIDVFQNRKPFVDDAAKIFIYAYNNIESCFLTAKSLTDIYYITYKATHSKVITVTKVKDLTTKINLIDTMAIDCVSAFNSEVTDYEDAVMIETALRCKMDCIVTRNISDYKKAKIKVCTPPEFLSIIE